MAKEGYEPIKSFEKALECEAIRQQGKGPVMPHGYQGNYMYFSSGLYSKQIEKYLQNFSKEQLLFLNYDVLRKNPNQLLKEIFSFLNVSTAFSPNIQAVNSRRQPHSVYLQYIFRNKMQAFDRALRMSLSKKLMQLNIKKQFTAKIKVDTRQRLQEQYRVDIEKTQNLTGLDLSKWLEGLN